MRLLYRKGGLGGKPGFPSEAFTVRHRRSQHQLTMPMFHGTNSWSPSPSSSLLLFSPEAMRELGLAQSQTIAEGRHIELRIPEILIQWRRKVFQRLGFRILWLTISRKATSRGAHLACNDESDSSMTAQS
jgi:hypothetical protein